MPFTVVNEKIAPLANAEFSVDNEATAEGLLPFCFSAFGNTVAETNHRLGHFLIRPRYSCDRHPKHITHLRLVFAYRAVSSERAGSVSVCRFFNPQVLKNRQTTSATPRSTVCRSFGGEESPGVVQAAFRTPELTLELREQCTSSTLWNSST